MRRSFQCTDRLLRATALACLLASIAGCVSYRWRARPLTDISLEQESLLERVVRFDTDSGAVSVRVASLAVPYVYGRAEGGTGPAAVDLQAMEWITLLHRDPTGGIIDWQLLPLRDVQRDPAPLVGRSVLFRTATGDSVILRDVRTVEDGWVEGRLDRSRGPIRVDLRRATGVQVREVNGPATAFRTIALIGGTMATAVLIVALTKESCPFVYVDRGNGWELVGEAYAGAAFRSTQREDLLPLPAPGSAGTLRVRLRNEARETQYTDRAELVLVEHAPTVRALSSFDGQVVLVGGKPAMALQVRDGRGRDLAHHLAAGDEVLAERDPVAVAGAEDGVLEDQVTAEFALPATGTPVLELVAGNTAWLDLVFGRFFAAMGDRLPTYLARGNDSVAGPRIRRWREREGVDLVVEMRSGGEGWQRVGVVPTVGPAALREIAIPLPVDSVDRSGTVQVRLRSGLGFWRFDRLALSVRDSASPEVRRISPRAALGTGGHDQRDVLASADGRYNALSEMNESVEMEFALPTLAEGRARTAFLFTDGYYNVHPPLQSEWLPGTLKAIRDEPAALSRFGRDLARAYQRRVAAAPAPTATRR